MKIGILSDTHDNSSAVEAALQQFRLRGVELLIHCGDIQSPETIRLFADLPTHFVFGNCDWQPDALAPAIADIGAQLHQPFGELEVGGKTIGWLHSHDLKLFLNLEFSDRFDYLFYGHTHKAEQHRRGKTLVVNPGAMFRVKQKTCLVLDPIADQFETIEVA
jgi:putative phosphoesterase